MYKIDNHNELALQDCIPYLLQFPEIYKILDYAGQRYQSIEDVAWELLTSLDYNQAEGKWLDYIGVKVGASRAYTPKPTDAFTFGGLSSEAFNRGLFKSASAISSTKNARNDELFRNAIRAKIITNNSNATIPELVQACKLLYNGKIVNIKESYPAGIDMIGIYGSSLIQELSVVRDVDKMLGAGIRANRVIYYNMYNLFRNNAFISYNQIVPSINDFELSLTVKPDELSETENTALLSQGATWLEETAPIRLYYDVETSGGVTFRVNPNMYSSNATGTSIYTDGTPEDYVDSEATVFLSGGTMLDNEDNNIRITKQGTTWSLYVNNLLVDSENTPAELYHSDSSKLFIGASNGKFYNSGSIYNLYLKDNTLNQILINDPLKENTLGNNNGVIWI